MAGAGHAEGKGASAAQIAAAEAAPPLRAAARLRGGILRALVRAPGRAAERAGRRRDRGHVGPGAGASGPGRLQAGDAAGAPVHELPRGRRAWPHAGRGPQPGAAARRVRQAGPGHVPAAGRARHRGGAGAGAREPDRLDLRPLARDHGDQARRAVGDRLSGAGGQGRALRPGRVRRSGRGAQASSRRPAEAVPAGAARAGQVPGKEPGRPDQDQHALYDAGHAGGIARPDHRLRAGPGLPGRALAGQPAAVRGPARRRQGPAGPAGPGSGAAGRRGADGIRGAATQAAPGQAARGRLCRPAAAAGRADAQVVHPRHALCPAVALSALSEGGGGAHRQAARRPGP